MWVSYALASAPFAGIMSILVKIGIKNRDCSHAGCIPMTLSAIRHLMCIVFWYPQFHQIPTLGLGCLPSN